MTTTYIRNRDMLKHYCDGACIEDLTQQYNLTKVMVQAGMRQALATIKEHTDYDAEVSFDSEIFSRNKAAILKHMQARIPTTPITQKAKQALVATFGEHYGQHPETVCEHWKDFPLTKSRYHHYRDNESVRAWLGSEGFLVDDYLDQDAINQTFEHIIATLKTIPDSDNLRVEITDGQYDRRVLYLDAVVSKGDHCAKRKFKVELVPAY